jgi:putative mRNA 3-end processing factor
VTPNRDAGRASVLYAYALGKAQRTIVGLAAALEDELPGPIYTHGAVETTNRAYREAGIALPPTTYTAEARPGADWSGALIVAPPSAHGSPWARRFAPASTAFASGWMRIRGARRRGSVDRGFVLSDHVDWPGLLAAIDATGAEAIWLTHGYTAVVARWLRERGRDARPVATRYEGEPEESVGSEAPDLSSPPADADDGPPG